MTQLAFLGTGTMGLPMARNLLRAGVTVHAWNRTLDRAKPLADDGAERFEDAAAAADGCPLMITMLSEALGVDPQVFFDAVEGGPLDLGYARLKGPAMMKRAFDDVSFRLALARKDADLVLAGAADVGLELPVMEGVVTRLRAAEADGHGNEDMAATYWASHRPTPTKRGRHARD